MPGSASPFQPRCPVAPLRSNLDTPWRLSAPTSMPGGASPLQPRCPVARLRSNLDARWRLSVPTSIPGGASPFQPQCLVVRLRSNLDAWWFASVPTSMLGGAVGKKLDARQRDLHLRCFRATRNVHGQSKRLESRRISGHCSFRIPSNSNQRESRILRRIQS